MVSYTYGSRPVSRGSYNIPRTPSRRSYSGCGRRVRSIFTAIERNDFQALYDIVTTEPSQVFRRTMDTGNTPLMEAARRGYLDMVKYLMHHGAKVYDRSDMGNTALIDAAFGGHSDVCEYLLQNGSKIDEQNKYGYSPLMCATFYGHEDCVKTLVKYKPQINLRNSDGRTALALALLRKNLDMIKYLKLCKGIV